MVFLAPGVHGRLETHAEGDGPSVIRLNGSGGQAVLELHANDDVGEDRLSIACGGHGHERRFAAGDPLLAEVAILETQTPDRNGWPVLCTLQTFLSDWEERDDAASPSVGRP